MEGFLLLRGRNEYIWPESERELLDALKIGGLVRVMVYESKGYEWLTCGSFDDSNQPPIARVGFIEQVDKSTEIANYRTQLKYLHFDEDGARFDSFHIENSLITPLDKDWSKYYDLLRQNNKWSGSLRLKVN